MSAGVQRRHESPELGDAIVRMLRGLVTRAAEGDWEAIEQLQRIDQLAPVALKAGVKLAHDGPAQHSYTQLGGVLGITRQAARQLVTSEPAKLPADAHQLTPGHTKRGCAECHDTPARQFARAAHERMHG